MHTIVEVIIVLIGLVFVGALICKVKDDNKRGDD